jgi:hypothetical protein
MDTITSQTCWLIPVIPATRKDHGPRLAQGKKQETLSEKANAKKFES